MAESIVISSDLTKVEQYKELLSQLELICEGEDNSVALLSLVAGALHEAFDNYWTGFYLVHDDELALGPYQGPLPCLRIGFGKGVCGTAWKEKETVIVPDVDQFPGHIACSSESKSEIVVPLFSQEGEVIAVLDIDSDELARYDEDDAKGLEQITNWLSDKL